MAALVTDAWVRPGSILGRTKRALRERYHSGLAKSMVRAANLPAIGFEVFARVQGRKGWAATLARNRWFQKFAAGELERLSATALAIESYDVPSRKARIREGHECAEDRTSVMTVFAYSYAALDIFCVAKQNGWRTVLGQIDPGPADERLMQQLENRHPGIAAPISLPPAEYWDAWRKEVALADRIVVNSAWSRKLISSAGVPSEKLKLVPLAYAEPAEAVRFRRDHPATFSEERPLRVLFLGQVSLRKGIVELMEAARILSAEPVVFWIVGPLQILPRAEHGSGANIGWYGAVRRSEVADWYRRADVLLFPTHSDGFGLTQLEAQAWGLPIIASRSCGDVVKNDVNGILLGAVSSAEIVEAIRRMLASPALLVRYSKNSSVAKGHSLDALGASLCDQLE